jgi:hypothetical protein
LDCRSANPFKSFSVEATVMVELLIFWFFFAALWAVIKFAVKLVPWLIAFFVLMTLFDSMVWP